MPSKKRNNKKTQQYVKFWGSPAHENHGVALRCEHTHSDISDRCVVLSLEYRNMQNYVMLDSERFESLLRSSWRAATGEIGLFAHQIALQQASPASKDELTYWARDTSFSRLFAPIYGQQKISDEELLSWAYRCCNTYVSDEAAFVEYLRQRYIAEQSIYSSKPVVVYDADTVTPSIGTEDYLFRTLRITCVPFNAGHLSSEPSWRIKEQTIKHWISSRYDAPPESIVFINLPHSKFLEMLEACSTALGLYDLYSELFLH